MEDLQFLDLHKEYNRLQVIYGEKSFFPIYGAGKIRDVNILLVFMNPTGRNVSAKKEWQGIRAPWIGTKNIWRLIKEIGVISAETHKELLQKKSEEWNAEFALELYKEVASSSCFITNLAKCTQQDARPLKDEVFKQYLKLLFEEIKRLRPKAIITFGNQVSSIVLSRVIKVGDYQKNDYESLFVEGREFKVFPTHYPVGQGFRNVNKALLRLKYIIKHHLYAS